MNAITSDQVDRWLRLKVKEMDKKYKQCYSGSADYPPYALGVLISDVTWALNDPKEARKLKSEIAACGSEVAS